MTSISSSRGDAQPGASGVDPLIGRVLDGRFRILSPIARGGMGAVYKAEQAPLGRIVALKIMSPRSDEKGNAEFRRRFFLEASTAAKLTHPNTVRVFDYGQTEDGYFFMAMELLDGRTLKKVISEEGPIEPARAAEIAKQVCRSLREAHRIGIVHRDIKPGNIMLVERGGEELAKVLDFGLAKDTSAQPTDPDDVTQTGVFLGSPKYVSPEQVQGDPLDARSDVYSLGVVLYEMLTGAPPFAFEQPMQVLMAHVRDAPPELAAPIGKTQIPPELAAVVLRALKKRADERWPDMEAFLVAIKESLGGPGSVSRDLLLSSTGEREHHSGQTSLSSSGERMLGTTTSSSGSVVGASPPPPSSGGLALDVTVELPTLEKETARGSLSPFYLAGAGVVLALAAATAWLLMPPSEPTAIAGAPPATGGEVVVAEPEAHVVAEVVPIDPEPPLVVRSVIVALRSSPPGAIAWLGERELGPTPLELEVTGEQAEVGREVEVVFRRAGYRDASEHTTIVGTRVELEARLMRLPRAAGGSDSTTPSEGATGHDVHVDGYRDSPY